MKLNDHRPESHKLIERARIASLVVPHTDLFSLYFLEFPNLSMELLWLFSHI